MWSTRTDRSRRPGRRRPAAGREKGPPGYRFYAADSPAQRAERAFILEPAFGKSGKLKTARKAVGNFTLTIKGRAAHAGVSPEEGVSAILELWHQVQRLFALNDPTRGITVNVGTIAGGTRSNVIAAEVRANIDVRVRTLDDAQSVESAIRSIYPRLIRRQRFTSSAASTIRRWSRRNATRRFGGWRRKPAGAWDWSSNRPRWAELRTATPRANTRRRSMA